MSTPDIRTSEPPAEPAAPEAPPPAEPAPEERPRRRRWLIAVVVAAVLLVVYLAFFRGSKRSPDDAGRGAAGAGKAGAARTVPVIAAAAHSGDLPVHLVGLGTVTPLNTVTVRSRVDGQLLTVNYKEGQLVHEGDVLAQIDPRPFQVQLTQAEGQQAKDRAALQNSQADLARFEALQQAGVLPVQQLDAQRATVRQNQASLESDQGAIDAAKLNITYARITAPISGRVGLRLVDPGNMVHASDANGIVVITQLEPITVVFSLPADRLPQVLAGFRAGKTLPVAAFDRDMRTQLAAGTLSAVDNQIDPTTGTVKLRATFPNQNGALFPNQFVNASLLVDTMRAAVLIPAAGIQRSPQSTYVWMVQPDSTVQMRNVEVALTEGDTTAIKSGLAAGDRVVVDGVDKLQPGTKVAATDAGSANPGAGSRGHGQGGGDGSAPAGAGGANSPASGSNSPASGSNSPASGSNPPASGSAPSGSGARPATR
jgi:membrane fusion protein, multidrug efflux system